MFVPATMLGEAVPVPPLATARVPASVTAPVVEVAGVSPVEPALKEVTPPVEADQAAVVPLEVRTYPLVPIPSRVAVPEPLPTIKSPVVVMGDKALKAAEAVVCPVPPLATGKAVPDREIARVPELVIGLPATDKKEGTVAATDVTVPEPPPDTVPQEVTEPSVVRNLPLLPV